MSQYGRLRRLGFLLTGDWAQGEELAQETLVTVYRRWPVVRSKEYPAAYARRVLVNRHRSLLRRLRLEALHLHRSRRGATDPGPGSERREELLVARAAIRQLPARQRAVVVLRYHEDLSEQEVAQLLGILHGQPPAVGGNDSSPNSDSRYRPGTRAAVARGADVQPALGPPVAREARRRPLVRRRRPGRTR